MTTKKSTFEINGIKYGVLVKQEKQIKDNDYIEREYFVSDCRGRLIFKLQCTRYPDRSMLIAGIECIGQSKELHDAVGFIAGGRDHASVFEKCLMHTHKRIGVDRRLSRQEHQMRVQNLLKTSTTHEQFVVGLRVNGYNVSADSNTDLDINASDRPDHLQVTMQSSPVRFTLQVALASGTVEL